jgi:hypothetical protein
MEPSSRTPEGEPNRCPICGNDLQIEPSRPPGDAPCPHCGYLLWFQAPTRRPDDRLIEHTRRQIQSLVQEIAQLSNQSLARDQYYGEFLGRVVAALAAVRGAVWTLNDDGRLALRYQLNLATVNLGDEESLTRHSLLLYHALGCSQGTVVAPHSGFGDDDRAGNLTDYLLVIAPLKTNVEMVGLVEVFQRGDAAPNVQKGYLRFLNQMCELAGDSVALRRPESRPQVEEPRRAPWWKFWRQL